MSSNLWPVVKALSLQPINFQLSSRCIPGRFSPVSLSGKVERVLHLGFPSGLAGDGVFDLIVTDAWTTQYTFQISSVPHPVEVRIIFQDNVPTVTGGKEFCKRTTTTDLVAQDVMHGPEVPQALRLTGG